jgi:hypothetical protein
LTYNTFIDIIGYLKFGYESNKHQRRAFGIQKIPK